MARITPLNYEEAEPQARAEWDRQIEAHGRMTNMKRTLAHSGLALEAYMDWYPLHDEVVKFLGDRSTNYFTYAISSQTDCLICSTFFRRILIESGENPEDFKLDERDQTVVEYGKQLAVDPHVVSDELFARLQKYFTDRQIVLLTAFGGLMIATNLINNSLQVELDDYLEPYRRPGKSSQAAPQPEGS